MEELRVAGIANQLLRSPLERSLLVIAVTMDRCQQIL